VGVLREVFLVCLQAAEELEDGFRGGEFDEVGYGLEERAGHIGCLVEMVEGGVLAEGGWEERP
jgi:hypothetical protein